MSSCGIKVAVRCRPYTIDDKLGVHMVQVSKDRGEVNLMNCTFSTKRFAFSWSWWSAYGWQRRQKGDEGIAKDMKLIHQGLAYEAVGVPARTRVLDGNAVVRVIQFVVKLVHQSFILSLLICTLPTKLCVHVGHAWLRSKWFGQDFYTLWSR